VQVPFTPGRTDASQEQTDVESFAALEPTFDGFRNYLGQGHVLAAENLLLERATVAHSERSTNDRARGRHARPERERRAVRSRRLHKAARDTDQRLLREPPRHGHGVAAGLWNGRDL